MIWTIIPFVDLWAEFTRQAALDVLAQSEPTRLLLINNGSSDEDRIAAEGFAQYHHPRVLLWSHEPQLPSLNECRNRALDFAWASGADRAWVVNNDARFHRDMLVVLSNVLTKTEALFVSGVGVREGQFNPNEILLARHDDAGRGGPDFSCFLISKECHTKYRFDPNLTYAGDCDYHRTLMLAGEGKRIFSVNVPYLHYASRTIHRSPEALEAHHKVNARHIEYYQKKWGGGPNQEKLTRPFDASTASEGMTNPEIQARG